MSERLASPYSAAIIHASFYCDHSLVNDPLRRLLFREFFRVPSRVPASTRHVLIQLI